MMEALQLILFGSPQVERNGVFLQLRTRKALALLVYLAVNTQPQSRETLAALFWPEFSSERAFANLREALRLLKQQLSDYWLDIRRQEITLKTNSALWIDVLEFQRNLAQISAHPHSSDTACADCLASLLAAIDLYRDDFLRGFTLPDSPAFDEWQFFQTDQLRGNLIEGLKRVIRYYVSHHDVPQAIESARRWVAQSPWSEAAHREMMRLYALNDQRSAALQQYRDCVRILREEFEVGPEEGTRALYETILHTNLTPGFLHPNPLPKEEGALLPSPSKRDGGGEVPPPHNLPAQTTSFIGRESEMAAVKKLLLQPNVRLLTLNGAGGSGKTRLALQVAAKVLELFQDGVFFVSLAPIGNPELVATTIAQTLWLYIAGNTTPLDILKGYLHQKQLLLILDNFEQLITASSILIDLLAAAPDVKIMVTSRTVLCLSAEQEYIVPPLQVPYTNALPSFSRFKQSEAVQLFVERAQAVSTDFTFTEDNALAVAEICGRLDGLPLAIELAAARVRLLPLHTMLDRLGSPLRFLTGGARDLPARQQTLRKTIEWSYHLLNEEEAILFRRLAVFVGGLALEAAETVCAIHDDLDVLTNLGSLIDHNLLTQDISKGDPRFTMLETIREYALERFAGSDEDERIRKRHAQFFVEFAKEAHTHLNRTPN